ELGSSHIGGLGMSANGLNYLTFETLKLTLGTGNDNLTITDTHDGTTAVKTQGGSDHIVINGISGATTIDAGAGADTIDATAEPSPPAKDKTTVPPTGTDPIKLVSLISALLTIDGGTDADTDILNVTVGASVNEIGTLTG